MKPIFRKYSDKRLKFDGKPIKATDPIVAAKEFSDEFDLYKNANNRDIEYLIQWLFDNDCFTESNTEYSVIEYLNEKSHSLGQHINIAKVFSGIKDWNDVDMKVRNVIFHHIKGFVNRYQYYDSSLGKSVKSYRKINIDDSTDIYADYGGIGIFWSSDESGALPYWAHTNKEYELMLEAIIPISTIDWESTFNANISSVGESESEITCIKGQPILITAINVEDIRKEYKRPIKVKA